MQTERLQPSKKRLLNQIFNVRINLSLRRKRTAEGSHLVKCDNTFKYVYVSFYIILNILKYNDIS